MTTTKPRPAFWDKLTDEEKTEWEQDATNPAYNALCCEGCGRIDPCGTHYLDCELLAPFDFVVERGSAALERPLKLREIAALCKPEHCESDEDAAVLARAKRRYPDA